MYYKSSDNKQWYGFEPENVECLVKVSEEEWQQHLIDIEPQKIDDNAIIKRNRIIELKSLLRDSDYKAIKHFEGLISDEEYEPIKQQRIAWRDEINQLEN